MAFSLNMTSDDIEKATAERPAFQPMPAGEYVACITDAELSEVSSSNTKGNAGKPMAKLEITVQDHETYEGRKLWPNIMLFEGSSSWFAAQLFVALGHDEWLDGEIPDDFLEDIQGENFIIVVKRKLDAYGMKKFQDENEGKPVPKMYRNEVGGFKSIDGDLPSGAGGAAKGNPMLP